MENHEDPFFVGITTGVVHYCSTTMSTLAYNIRTISFESIVIVMWWNSPFFLIRGVLWVWFKAVSEWHCWRSHIFKRVSMGPVSSMMIFLTILHPPHSDARVVLPPINLHRRFLPSPSVHFALGIMLPSIIILIASLSVSSVANFPSLNRYCHPVLVLSSIPQGTFPNRNWVLYCNNPAELVFAS